MVDQPEGRPKSPGPGKIKPAKKHVSKPYERPSSSRVSYFIFRMVILSVTSDFLLIFCWFFADLSVVKLLLLSSLTQIFLQGVLARVRELITPVTPAWLKDLVLKPPTVTPVTSVTDHLEITVAAQVSGHIIIKHTCELTPKQLFWML